MNPIQYYRYIHNWIRSVKGKPETCEHCKCGDESVKKEWANISGEYKEDISDWVRLCRKCHKSMDTKSRQETDFIKEIRRLNAVVVCILTDQEKEVIREAASIEKRSMTGFMVYHGLENALKILLPTKTSGLKNEKVF